MFANIKGVPLEDIEDLVVESLSAVGLSDVTNA